MGRPSSYTEEKAEEICRRLAEGQSLLTMCSEDSMPPIRTVFDWLERYEDFSHKYARAREMQGHARADMAVHSAVEARDAGLGRLAYDALKWHASKLVPKVYGDKTEVVVKDADRGPVQTVTVSTSDPIEAARVYQKLMSEG